MDKKGGNWEKGPKVAEMCERKSDQNVQRRHKNVPKKVRKRGKK